MKRILMTLALVFSVNAVHAADKGDWRSWYDGLVKGLKSKVEKRFESKTRVTAVAAVRGAKQGSDPMALYWKGGVSEAARKKMDAEKAQLADAVQLVLDGDLPAGKAALGKFIKDNPDSVYLPEAKEALERLPAEEAKPAAAEAAPAAKPAAAEAAPAAKPAPAEKQPAPAAQEKPAASN